MKRCLKIVTILLVSLIFSSYVFAAEANKDDVTLSVASRDECIIKFGKYGEFEKKLVEIDEENKTIDVSLTARNTYSGSTTRDETTEGELPGEVVLLIDSSNSMNYDSANNYVPTSSESRKALVSSAATELVEKLFNINSDIKIGVVEFSSATGTGVTYGTDADASKLLDLSNSKSSVKEAIANVSASGGFTDLDIGLKVANTLFSSDSDTKKYLVVLTDGVPNLNENNNTYGYSSAVVNATKNRLSSIEGNGINLVSLLIDISGTLYAETFGNSFGEDIDYMEIAEQIFGTTTNPNYGSVYYVQGTGVTDAITNTIYNDLITSTTTTIDETEKYTLTDVVIKDYFPQNIVDNFDFNKLTEPQIGTVSDYIDTDDNSITWDIPELKPGESTTFTYRLSLKDTFDGEIIDLNLPTNEKVTIDYKEGGEAGEPKESNDSPAVKLTAKDDTTAPTPIPQTGSYTWIAIALATVFGLGVTAYGAIKSYTITR